MFVHLDSTLRYSSRHAPKIKWKTSDAVFLFNIRKVPDIVCLLCFIVFMFTVRIADGKQLCAKSGVPISSFIANN